MAPNETTVPTMNHEIETGLQEPHGDPNQTVNNSFETATAQPTVDPTLSRTNNIVLIPQLEVIDKELAYKQRLNRPFKVVQNLPLSVDLPDYGLLDHSLSVKDSATLYNSLIVSRHNWIYNVFRSYWTRREQYINVLNDRKRDKMSKLCDMKLAAGPHTFEIKLFILKDDEKERLHQEDIERKREEKQRRKDEKLKKEQEVKIKLENQITEAQLKLQNSTENNPSSTEANKVDENDRKKESENQDKDKTDLNITNIKKDNDGDTDMKEASFTKPKGFNTIKPSNPTSCKETNTKSQQVSQSLNFSSSNSNLKKRSEVLPNTTKTALRPTSTSTPASLSKTTTSTPTASKLTTTSSPSTSTPHNKPSNSDIMSNPENAIMIQNLNSMAKKDDHLSELMRIVASGKATPLQITEFQKYIQKAREMGDVHGIYKKLQEENFLKQEHLKKQNELMRLETERAKLEKIRLKEEREKEKIRIKQEKTELKLKMQEEKERLKQMKREERDRERDMKRMAKERQREESRIERERERETKRDRKEQEKLEKQQRREERERLKIDREREKEKEKERQKEFQKKLLEEGDDKLTAFQERYATGATLVFEFYENSSARYFMPRNTIYEIIDDEADFVEDANFNNQPDESTITGLKQEDGDRNSISASPIPTSYDSTEKAKKKKRKSPYVDLLCSFVIVHNQSEIDAWDKRQKLKKEEEEAKKREVEETRKKHLEQQQEEANESPALKQSSKKRRKKKNSWGTSKRHTRNATAKQTQVEDEEEKDEYAPEPDEEDLKPTPCYSTTTIKLTEVPFKFAELIKNSGNPVPQVQEYMKQIFKEGERLNRFNVWYQLDGVKDELLGETLRFNLNRLDYVNGGGRLKGKAMLKRIVEKSGSEAEVTKKRSRR